MLKDAKEVIFILIKGKEKNNRRRFTSTIDL